jgi:hypothetical protein
MFALGPGGPSRFDIPLGFLFGGSAGALVGAVGAPILSWTVLRSVPLGRAITLTALGTLVGGAVGLLTGWYPLMLGIVGFVVASLVARATSSRKSGLGR